MNNDQKNRPQYRCIAVAGAGGKTSAIRTLAERYSAMRNRIVITTTTKMWNPGCPVAHNVDEAAEMLEKQNVVWAAESLQNEGKIGTLPQGSIGKLKEIADIVLIEADGSKGLPLKITRDDEPVIPPEADFVILVAGMDCLGRPFSEVCHRYQLLPDDYLNQVSSFANTCIDAGEEKAERDYSFKVTPHIVADIMKMSYLTKISMLGLPHIILLNIVNYLPSRQQLEEIKEYLKWDVCIISKLNKKSGLLEVPGRLEFQVPGEYIDRTDDRHDINKGNSYASLIIMASGRSRRFNGNKLFSEFEGKTLIENTMDKIPSECFGNVYVVSGDERILALAMYKKFTPVFNYHPDEGISRSIKLGIRKSLEDGVSSEKEVSYPSGALFMVGDQPLLTGKSIKKIMQAAAENPGRIIIPTAKKIKQFSSYMQKNITGSEEKIAGNPCFFPRLFFGELMKLEGDNGGKKVIEKHPELIVTVDVPAEELMDIDKKEDYEELLKKTR